jgi:hypothetical protein
MYALSKFFSHIFSASTSDVCHVANIVFKRTPLPVMSRAKTWAKPDACAGQSLNQRPAKRDFVFAVGKSKAWLMIRFAKHRGEATTCGFCPHAFGFAESMMEVFT